jgi:hypothetical protein
MHFYFAGTRLESIIGGHKVEGLEEVTERSRPQTVVEGRMPEATEQRRAQGRLHMAAADWRALNVVMCYNSPDCPLDYVLYN